MLRLRRVRYHCMQLRCALAAHPHYLTKPRSLCCVAPRSYSLVRTRLGNTSHDFPQFCLQQQPHLVRSFHSQTLPWSEVLPYRSVRVDLAHARATGWALKRIEDFSPLLQTHLAQWKSEGRNGVWLYLPLELGALIPLAAELGFRLHHAREERVVMTCWLSQDKPNKLPHYASHQVGVCGVVYREDTDEVLVVQDRFKLPKWKFPGGLSEHAEDIADTAVREVLEETGVQSEFHSLLAFRQQHHLPTFDCSDLYFICRLRPLTFELHPCKDEVERCQWMALSELAVSEEATPLSHRIVHLLLEGQERGFPSVDISVEEWPSIFPNMTYKVFLRTKEQNITL